MANADNPKAFKHWISPALLAKMARVIASAYPTFRARALTGLSKQLGPLELKDRVRLVSATLRELLPPDYPAALAVLLEAAESPELKGFDFWPFTEFVQAYGLMHFDESMRALHLLTQKFTSEFAVRPFLIRYPEETLALLGRHTRDPSPHVRRWISEGTRPRLPWGERLHALVADPAPTLRLLDELKYDPELYVRTSVANHLNDIAKDHPAVVVRTLGQWTRAAPAAERDKIAWIARRALRTLIKKGDPAALELLGVAPDAAVRARGLRLNQARFRMNEVIELRFVIQSESESDQKLVVDYLIHHAGANGARGPKVFKLKTFVLGAGERVEITKKHALRPITTRTYYPGEHLLEIQINGRIRLRKAWELC
jgi:3-methyladenine DNA glycosylase AlkC